MPVPLIPTGTVTDTVSPAAKVEAASWYSCAGEALEPEKRNSVYEERSVINGASPESVQVTVNAVPPGRLAPAAGTENATSQKARGADASRVKIALEKRMVVFSTLSAKRVTCARTRNGLFAVGC